MNVPSPTELNRRVIEWVRAHKKSNGIEVTEDTDLLAAGVLDSLGVVDLLVFIEAESGRAIDLTDIDPAEFSSVRRLCVLAARTANASVESA